MARRLCLDERARVEAMAQAGLSAAQIAERLGRHRATVYRELGRNGGPGGHGAEAAQAAACIRAGRPKAPKLAEDAELAAAVCERLAMRWSPQAISADLRTLGLQICAETIYRACYDRTGRRGLVARNWAASAPTAPPPKAPRAHRAGQTLGSGRVPAPNSAAGESRHQSRARTLVGRLGHRQSQPHRGGHPGRKSQPPHPGGAVARRLQRPRHSPGRL